jgi:cytochrome c-type biogenesis protein CcmH
MNDDIQTLRQQLKQLQSLRDSGALDAQAHEAAKAPLERKLLDKVLHAPPATADAATAAAAAAPAATPRPAASFVALLSALVLVLAVVGYGLTGSPGMPSAGAPGAVTASEGGAPHGDDRAQFAAAVEKLAQRMKEQPDNAEGWAILARSYARLDRHAEAVPAFEKALALAGDNAGLMADFADTLAVQNNRSLEGRPTELLNRALKLEPDNAKALALAGTAAFNRKDYAGAVRLWEHLGRVGPPDVDFVKQLQGSIDEARSLGGLGPGKPVRSMAAATGETGTPAAAAATPGAATGAAGAGLQGSVRLAPALAKLASPTDTVFIFARAAEGPRMPLAILRHQVKDLPVSFKLDDSLAMSPATRLSAFPKVVISARISKSGQATPSAGDLTGQSAPVANDAHDVVIDINEVVKN